MFYFFFIIFMTNLSLKYLPNAIICYLKNRFNAEVSLLTNSNGEAANGCRSKPVYFRFQWGHFFPHVRLQCFTIHTLFFLYINPSFLVSFFATSKQFKNHFPLFWNTKSWLIYCFHTNSFGAKKCFFFSMLSLDSICAEQKYF